MVVLPRRGSVRGLRPALLLLSLASMGCHLIYPFSAQAPADAVPDLGALDSSPRDSGVDAVANGDQAAPGSWCKPGWSHRKPLTITKVSQELIDFPVLVSLTDKDLVARARADGRDIAFCLPGGAPLAYEREAYTSSSGRLVAWVKVPKLGSTGPTVIQLYYGNSGAADQQQPQQVWTNGYLGVWHFHTPPPQLMESSANKHHGKATGQMTAADVVSGKIGDAYHFDGVDDMVVANYQALKPTGALTVSAWFRMDPKDTDYDDDELVSATSVEGDKGYNLCFDEDATYDPTNVGCRAVSFRGSYDGTKGFYTGWTKVCPPPLGSWYHLTGVFKPSSFSRFYLDGAMTKENNQTVGAALHASSKPFTLGAESHAAAGRAYFMGELDEVRVSNVPRSPAWIAASYANQSAPSTFVKPGLQEAAPK